MGIENGIFTAGRLQSLLPNTVSVLELKRRQNKNATRKRAVIIDCRFEGGSKIAT